MAYDDTTENSPFEGRRSDQRSASGQEEQGRQSSGAERNTDSGENTFGDTGTSDQGTRWNTGASGEDEAAAMEEDIYIAEAEEDDMSTGSR
jgi:hypothetical protein